MIYCYYFKKAAEVWRRSQIDWPLSQKLATMHVFGSFCLEGRWRFSHGHSSERNVSGCFGPPIISEIEGKNYVQANNGGNDRSQV
jgi:hypothetical protein